MQTTLFNLPNTSFSSNVTLLAVKTKVVAKTMNPVCASIDIQM